MSTYNARLTIDNKLARDLTDGKVELKHGTVSGSLPTTVLAGQKSNQIDINATNGNSIVPF